MSQLRIRIVEHGSLEYEETLALRDEILRKPLGLTFDPEQLGSESGDFHIACYRGDDLVGCLVLTPRDVAAIKMRQVAVRADEQGSGIGREMVRASEDVARDQGFVRMVLNARATVVPFYEKLGYSVVGEPFEEVTIPHRAMERVL